MTGKTLVSRVEGSDRYTLTDVAFNGELVDVAFAKKLGRARQQYNFVERYHETDFRLPASDLYFAVLRRLVDHRDSKEEKKLYDVLCSDFEHHRMLTGTRVAYSGQKNKDRIIHDWRTKNERVIEGLTMVGVDGPLSKMSNKHSLTQAYFSSTPKEVREVFLEFSHQPIYLWRVNNKNITCEKAVRLGLVRQFVVDTDYGNTVVSARGVVVSDRKGGN